MRSSIYFIAVASLVVVAGVGKEVSRAQTAESPAANTPILTDTATRMVLQKETLELNKKVIVVEFETIKKHLTSEETTKLGNAQLEFRNSGGPMDFFASQSAEGNKVSVSEPGMRAVGIIALAAVMGEQMNDPKFFTQYFLYARGRFRAGQFIEDPLRAAGWTFNDLTPEAKHKYAMLSTQIQTVVLAHEIAHLLKKHEPTPLPGSSKALMQLSQRNESEADAFSLQILKRMKCAPTAPVVLFTTMALVDQRAYSKDTSTHPPATQRLKAAAQFGIDNAKSFTWEFKDPDSKLEYKIDSGAVLDAYRKAVAEADQMATPQGVKEMDEKAGGMKVETLRRPKPKKTAPQKAS